MEQRRRIGIRWIKVAVMMFMMCFIGGVFHKVDVKAASCEIELSLQDSEIAVGKAFNMKVTITGQEIISGVEMLLNYDADALEFVTASSQVTGGEGTLKIEDTDIATPSNKISYVIKFEVKEAGTSYIKVEGSPAIYNEESGQSMSAASNVLAISTKAEVEESSNNLLKSLKIGGGELSPAFSSKVYDYETNLSSGTKNLIISAKPEDEKATVKVTGADDLKEGQNKISIIVMAQNGDTREYTLLATVNQEELKEENEEQEQENEEITDTKKEIDSSITVIGEDDPLTIVTQRSFMVHELEDDTMIPNGYQRTTILIDSTEVTAYEKSNEFSDFVLIYASTAGTKKTFYQYDKKEQTLQRFVQPVLQNEQVDVTTEDTTVTSNEKHSKGYDYLLIALTFLSILFMGSTVILLMKQRKRRK